MAISFLSIAILKGKKAATTTTTTTNRANRSTGQINGAGATTTSAAAGVSPAQAARGSTLSRLTLIQQQHGSFSQHSTASSSGGNLSPSPRALAYSPSGSPHFLRSHADDDVRVESNVMNNEEYVQYVLGVMRGETDGDPVPKPQQGKGNSNGGRAAPRQRQHLSASSPDGGVGRISPTNSVSSETSLGQELPGPQQPKMLSHIATNTEPPRRMFHAEVQHTTSVPIREVVDRICLEESLARQVIRADMLDAVVALQCEAAAAISAITAAARAQLVKACDYALKCWGDAEHSGDQLKQVGATSATRPSRSRRSSVDSEFMPSSVSSGTRQIRPIHPRRSNYTSPNSHS
eukprot:PhM_4_TR18717/c0_g2_i1/m.62402